VANLFCLSSRQCRNESQSHPSLNPLFLPLAKSEKHVFVATSILSQSSPLKKRKRKSLPDLGGSPNNSARMTLVSAKNKFARWIPTVELLPLRPVLFQLQVNELDFQTSQPPVLSTNENRHLNVLVCYLVCHCDAPACCQIAFRALQWQVPAT
jgi:hypothetical protein